jgi:hypothetical protein
MPDPILLLLGLSTGLACASVGGGLYEFTVVDPFWPRRPDLVQPNRGGISRKRFWMPAHSVFELTLLASLLISWSHAAVRSWLLIALASHAIMRIWSAFDFIPKALAFERADPQTVSEAQARRWTRRSLWRLPIDIVTCASMLFAFAILSQGGAAA